MSFLKRIVNGTLGLAGYHLVRLEGREVPLAIPESQRINVFDILVDKLAASTSKPSFVQIGAHDGITLDPLRKHILRHGLIGILVEPQPALFRQLIMNYAGQSQLAFENAVVSHKDGIEHLYTVNSSAANSSLLATLNRDVLVSHVGNCADIIEMPVEALTWRSLLARHRMTHVDIVQIDTEGFDFEILKFVLSGCERLPTLFQFEHIHLLPTDKVASIQLLASYGYQMLSNTTDTIAFCDRSGRDGLGSEFDEVQCGSA